MTEANPTSVFDYVRDAYLRYYDSAFWLRDQGMLAERRAILMSDGVLSREPLIEAIPQYPSVDPIEDVCKEAGLSSFVAQNLGQVVFGAGSAIKLRRHQAQALKTATSGGDNGLWACGIASTTKTFPVGRISCFAGSEWQFLSMAAFGTGMQIAKLQTCQSPTPRSGKKNLIATSPATNIRGNYLRLPVGGWRPSGNAKLVRRTS